MLRHEGGSCDKGFYHDHPCVYGGHSESTGVLCPKLADCEKALAAAEAQVTSIRAEHGRYWLALERISELGDDTEYGCPASAIARAAILPSPGQFGCTCRRITYDEAHHELHEHGWPVLDDN
jgi:hypothetical protein